VYRASTGHETREPELLGQTLLEGMACGLPGVCTDVASMPEIVRHGETGFVVPPYDLTTMGDCLRRLAGDERLVRRLGTRARDDIGARFSWSAVVARCLRAYAGEERGA
jgi:glycosyltransferase involved in cell wall biosynthesis